MKDSTKRLYSSLLSLGFIAGSFYVYFSLIVPALSEVHRLRGERVATEIDLAEFKKAAEETRNLQRTYQSVEAFRSNLSQLLPTKENIPPLMNQVYGLAALNQVAVSGVDFQISPPEPAGSRLVFPMSKITVSVRFSGKYDDMKRFLKDLESNLRMFDIRSVNISGGGRADPLLDVSLTFDTYFQPRLAGGIR